MERHKLQHEQPDIVLDARKGWLSLLWNARFTLRPSMCDVMMRIAHVSINEVKAACYRLERALKGGHASAPVTGDDTAPHHGPLELTIGWLDSDFFTGFR